MYLHPAIFVLLVMGCLVGIVFMVLFLVMRKLNLDLLFTIETYLENDLRYIEKWKLGTGELESSVKAYKSK